MQRLFNPRAVALVGASPEAAKLSGRPLAYFLRYGYQGKVYPVNPNYQEIAGLPCYPTPEAVPDPVDLALILLPARHVADALRACGQRGIPYAVVVASGFAEAGNQAAQDELHAICRTYGIRLIGPNCVGVVHPPEAVTASFSTVLGRGMFRSGGLALVTQSGALGNSLVQTFQDTGVGIRSWISTGNEVDLGALDFVEYFLEDPLTSAIALFLEGLKDGSHLLDLGRRARARGKPLIVLRAGRSARGRTASLSHTGKLAGSPRVWDAVARQAGLVEVRSLDELADVCLGIQLYPPARPLCTEGLGVLTVSGGLGVMISDACDARGITLPEFQPATQAAFRELLPSQAAVANPVDTALFADDSAYLRCAEIVLGDDGVGAMLLVLSSLAHRYDSLVRRLAELGQQARAAHKLLAITYLSSSDPLAPEDRRHLTESGVLVLPTPERIVAVLAALHGLRHPAPAAAGMAPAAAGMAPAAAGLAPAAAATPEERLAAAGVPLVPQALCRTRVEAVAAARRLGFPVAMKVASADLPHKTEVDGLRLNLRSAAALAGAWQDIRRSVAARAPGSRLDGMWVQRMVQGGIELILGCSIDPELGRVVMAGAGGIWAEVLGDVTFRALPLAAGEAAAMLRELKLYPLLAGARGRPPLDVAAAARAIEALAALFGAETWLREVDVNPLIVLPAGQGAFAVDCLVVPAAPPVS